MSGADRPPAGYRACVGVVLINGDGLVFAGRRGDVGGDAWQMPQGGIDAGETPRRAALRELAEEIGTDKAEILAETAGWLTYDLPEAMRPARWRGRYVGQAQRWVLMRFTGDDSDIDIAASDPPEFDAWRWMALDDLVRGIVAFKRPVYEQIARAFHSEIEGLSGEGS